MPINSFSSFTDGLEASRRNREHFVTNVNLEDERLWGRKHYREAELDVRELDALVR